MNVRGLLVSRTRLQFCVIFHVIIVLSFPNIDVIFLLITIATKLIWCCCCIMDVEVISTWVKFCIFVKYSIPFKLYYCCISKIYTILFLHVYNVH